MCGFQYLGRFTVQAFLVAIGSSALQLIPFASASIIFSNYTGVPNSNPYNLYGPSVAGGAATELAEGFTAPAGEYTLDSIEVLVDVLSGYSGLFNLSLYSSSGIEPAVQIEQLGTDLIAPNSPGTVTATSLLHPMISAGTDYWVVLSAADPNTYLHNYGGGTGPLPTEYYDASSGWSLNPIDRDIQLEVDGTSSTSQAPEPATLIPICASLVLLRSLAKVSPKDAADPS